MANDRRKLRLLVTKHCPFACVFCHNDGIENAGAALLSASDYRFLYRFASLNCGVSSVTLSGGEPLFRNDIVEIAKGIRKEGGSYKI